MHEDDVIELILSLYFDEAPATSLNCIITQLSAPEYLHDSLNLSPTHNGEIFISQRLCKTLHESERQSN